jgi:exodeoxyribonuclease V alpha subunit
MSRATPAAPRDGRDADGDSALARAAIAALQRARPGEDAWVVLALRLLLLAREQGRLALPQALFARRLADALGQDVDSLGDWRGRLLASPAVSDDSARSGAVLVLEHGHAYLRAAALQEARIADAMRDLVPAGFVADSTGDPETLAARHAGSARLLLISGGPGSGKTTLVARLLAEQARLARAAGQPEPRVVLLAPTGRAAARLGEAMRAQGGLACPVQTVHRWLRQAPALVPVDRVVVDEASMLDPELAQRLLAALPPRAGLWLVGDSDQLPAVQAGELFAPLCAAADAGRLPHVHLSRSHRTLPGLDTALLVAAVRKGDEEELLAGLAAGVRGVAWRRPEAGTAWSFVAEAALAAYRAVQRAADPAQALQEARRFRLLCAGRHGPAGSRALNAALARELDPTRRGGDFHGRLLMVVQNQTRLGLYNGDTGILWRDAQGRLVAWFEAESGLRGFGLHGLPPHEDAWALTVHKAQGSEFEAVQLLLPDQAAEWTDRAWLYTGLTRARRELGLWASPQALRQVVARAGERGSGLVHRLLA